MIEAMACGTPVIAFRNGSVPEVLQDGVTGFIVDSEAAAVEAVARVPALKRERIRAEFDQRFTSRHMAQNYLKLYSRLQHLRGPALRNYGSVFQQHSAMAQAAALPLLPRAANPVTAA